MIDEWFYEAAENNDLNPKSVLFYRLYNLKSECVSFISYTINFGKMRTALVQNKIKYEEIHLDFVRDLNKKLD